MSPPRSPKTPRAQGPTSADGEAEQLVQSGTIEVVDVVQPQVAVPIHDEAHQPSGSEPTDATTDEVVRSTRANPSATTPSAPPPDVLMTSAQQEEEEDVVPATGPGT